MQWEVKRRAFKNICIQIYLPFKEVVYLERFRALRLFSLAQFFAFAQNYLISRF